jgi:hypothetical protein
MIVDDLYQYSSLNKIKCWVKIFAFRNSAISHFLKIIENVNKALVILEDNKIMER